MATSYANSGGTGDRRSIIGITAVGGNGDNTAYGLINGNTSDSIFYLNVTTGCSIEFFFNTRKIIDEAKFYQSGSQSHGTWKWQGSNDRSSWTDIGSTFTLGGATTQTFTSLSGNTTGYQFYRILQTAGNTSNGPYIQEFEFKIEEESGYATYSHALGSGDRTGTITVSNSGITWSGADQSALVNGLVALVSEPFWDADTNSGDWQKFDLGSAVLMTQCRIWFDIVSNQGTWKWQGSTDNSNWTDLTSADVVTNPSADCPYLMLFQSNVTDYRYYRLLGVSGSRVADAYVREFEFAIGDSIPASPTTAHVASTFTLYA